MRFHSHLSSGLRLRNYRAVAANHKFSSRFSGFCVFLLRLFKQSLRLSGNFILLKASLFNKGLPFRACEQPIRRQNLFVRCLLNGVIETVIFLRSCGLCEEKYDYSGADPENSERGTLLSQGAAINILHKAQGRLATFNSCTCDWGDQQKAQNCVDIGVEA